MKLFSHSLSNNTKAEKVNHVDITSTISNEGNLYLLVLCYQRRMQSTI